MSDIEITTAEPSKELFLIAVEQAKKLNNNEQLRVTGAEHTYSYEVFNLHGSYYIGRDINSPCRKFFKTRPVYTFKDGKYEYELQRLFR